MVLKKIPKVKKLMEVLIKCEDGAKLPVFGSKQAAGADLCAFLKEDFVLKAHTWYPIPTGCKISLPDGYEAQIRPRSGLAVKYGLSVLNTPGTVDPDYRGEIFVILINHSEKDFTIHNGDRIAQIVINKFEKINFKVTDKLPESERGEKGLGSTGIN